ncbi:WD40-repeat-containing domain protein [Obelidium mucronatum]|nr:WD40-repeat-containing domain protein [Obelidium mucronatum]
MKAKTLQINWHDKMPIFSVSFSPTKMNGNMHKLATAGGDHNIRLWAVTLDEETNTSKLEFLATLNRHSSVVNCIRWSPKGDILASGGDDGTLILWQQCEKRSSEAGSLDATEDADNKEHWKIFQILRGCSADIYDIVWSPQAEYVMAGCVDNSTRIWDIKQNKCIHTLTEHSNFVQGVTWDPLDGLIASQSSDRFLNIYKIRKDSTDGVVRLVCCARQSRVSVPLQPLMMAPEANSDEWDTAESKGTLKRTIKLDVDGDYIEDELETPTTPSTKKQKTTDSQLASTTTTRMFHDDTLSSFFRRLSFSPDGSLLVAPAGLYREKPKDIALNVVYIFSRENIRGEPIARLTGFKKPVIAISFSPVLYQHKEKKNSTLKLPHRMVFAVASQDSVVVYDSSVLERPLAVISNLHFGTLTDISWASNGKILFMSSTDGYNSIVTFTNDDLGTPIKSEKEEIAKSKASSEINANESTEQLAVAQPLIPAAVNVLNSNLIKKKRPTAAPTARETENVNE